MKRADVFSGKKLYSAVVQNPKRVGTNAWHSFNLIQLNEGIRFEDFIAAGGRRLDDRIKEIGNRLKELGGNNR